MLCPTQADFPDKRYYTTYHPLCQAGLKVNSVFLKRIPLIEGVLRFGVNQQIAICLTISKDIVILITDTEMLFHAVWAKGTTIAQIAVIRIRILLTANHTVPHG